MSLLQIGKRRKTVPQLKDKIYLSFSSEGYGHSSRAIAIARQFQPGEILLGSYSYALSRIRSYDYPSVEVSQEIRFVGSEGHFDVGKTILSNARTLVTDGIPALLPTMMGKTVMSKAALGFNQIIQEEIDIIKRHGITLVVADGRMAPVLAAEYMDIPCIVLTNQSAFYPFFERDSGLVKLFGRSVEWVMKLWLSSAEEIWIPDFAPPYTVCLPNLSDNYQVKKRTRFIGPLVAWQADEVEAAPKPNPNRPLIVASLGGHEYRRPLFDAILQAARTLQNVDFIVISNFSANNVPENVQIHPFVKDSAPYFKAADLVITQAGHSTAMELLTLGKPSLVVPDARQVEQENNARRLLELGVSLKMEYDELSQGEQAAFCSHIQHLLESPTFGERTREFADMAAKVHGAKAAADHLREFAHRLSAY
ncbi:MAG TPA: glycosyltransferase [Oculatellaceae cyanobacterium]|jgi:UDP-N-acetylglucosamine--N-acetylmuramyl-(pentapeptide) pyrophosphoryl-undecaprenol N-acetylglucosamine transferase